MKTSTFFGVQKPYMGCFPLSSIPVHDRLTGWTWFIIINALASSVASLPIVGQEIDNGIIGEPEVKCGADVVDLQFRTMKPFKGKVFVKGHYAEPDCRVDYTDIGSTDKPNGGIVIQHGACDMKRQRMISPQGMQFSSVIVISFHPVFITKIDKAYHIKCMYRELDKTVTNGIEVSDMTTSLLAHTLPMPQCTYTIRKDEIDGEVMRYARVGEQVVHRWECDTEAYGILVHSCYVEDGQGERVTVVDEKGCHTDRYVLGDPTYVEKLNMAYRESHVFKFADKVAVRFQCQIRLCLKMDEGCKGITPPICPSPTDGNSPVIYSNLTRGVNATGSGFGASITGIEFEALNESVIEGGENELNDTALSYYHRRFVRAGLINDQKENRRGNDHSLDHNGPYFEPIDGDFTSQDIYVLDTIENPEKGSPREQEAWKGFLERSGDTGTIISDMRDSVCMSTMTFSLLMAAFTIVLMAAALASFIIAFQRSRRLNYKSGHVGECKNGADSVFGCGETQGMRSRSSAISGSVVGRADNAIRPPGYEHSLWNH